MKTLLSIALTLMVAGTASAQTPTSAYDRIWRNFTDLYVDDSNPLVQRVILSGRFHYEFADVDAEEGDNAEWNVRRLRIGPRIVFFKNFLLHSELELDPQRHNPFYVRFTDFYVQWTNNPKIVLTVGKQGALFTLDGSTSSRELLTIDRSNLANNIWFPQEYIPGVSLSGRSAPWVYRVGMYSAGAMNREFGEFNGGTATLGVLGYDFASKLGVKEALMTGNYVYQTDDPNNTFTRQLQHIGSINFRFEATRWGARGDYSRASGYLGQPDLWAFQAMPFVNISPKFQVVGRHTYIKSNRPNGIRFATYESRVVPGRGDKYNELYAGANYYFYGHKLKVQTGVQLSDMNDKASDGGEFSGLSWTTGLRVGW
jgi:phosphate-selective porin OprO/OprP